MAKRIVISFLLFLFADVGFAYKPSNVLLQEGVDTGARPGDAAKFPVNPPRDRRLPPPNVQEDGKYELKLIASKSWSLVGKTVSGTEIDFEYRGYRCHAEEVVGDLESEQFIFKGKVNILSKDAVIEGEVVYVNFSARTFRVENGEVDLKPALLKGRALSDIYLSAKVVEGTESQVICTHGLFTTCDHLEPHYFLSGRDVRIIPDRKVTLNGVDLWVLDRKIFGIPSVTIPLNRRTGSLTPDIGQSRDEGYYVKFRFGVPLKRDTGIARVEYMTKRGASVGFDYDYETARSKGSMKISTDFQKVQNALSYNFDGSHTEQFDFGEFTASGSVRQFSYLTGTSNTNANMRLAFRPKQGSGASTFIGYQRGFNESSGFRSVNNNLTLTDTRLIGKDIRTNVSVTLTDNIGKQAGSVISRLNAFEIRADANLDFRKGILSVLFSRLAPIGESINFVGGINKTPEIIVKTDKTRLFGTQSKIPEFQVSLSSSRYNDNFNKIKVDRHFLDFIFRNSHTSKSGLSVNYDFGFRQGLYSNNTAQYASIGNIALSYKIGHNFAVNTRYNVLKQRGFSPIQADRFGEIDTSSFDLTATIGSLSVTGSSGFDFSRNRKGFIAWQSPQIRAEYRPSDQFRLRAQATYLSQEKAWGNIRGDLAWKHGETTLLAGVRYDALRSTWANVNFLIDGLTIGRLKISTLLQYNGFLKRFDTQQYSFTYDMHCTEAVLQVLDNRFGFRPGREILFFIRIKAFPFDSRFGTGQFGQPTGVGTGFDP